LPSVSAISAFAQNAGMSMRALRLLLAACVLWSWPLAAGAGSGSPRLAGTVVGVVDGDTVDVRLASGMIRLRLHAIDAPESGQPHGKAAKVALSDLVFGKAVEVEPFEQDRYDRLVARIWLGDDDINAAMLKGGHAWTYRRYASEPAYCAYESAARDLGRGLWRLPPDQRSAPWEWRQRKSRGGVFTDYSKETVASCVAALGR
jgi:endonuclease YncB( thermonuclease family)